MLLNPGTIAGLHIFGVILASFATGVELMSRTEPSRSLLLHSHSDPIDCVVSLSQTHDSKSDEDIVTDSTHMINGNTTGLDTVRSLI